MCLPRALGQGGWAREPGPQASAQGSQLRTASKYPTGPQSSEAENPSSGQPALHRLTILKGRDPNSGQPVPHRPTVFKSRDPSSGQLASRGPGILRDRRTPAWDPHWHLEGCMQQESLSFQPQPAPLTSPNIKLLNNPRVPRSQTRPQNSGGSRPAHWHGQGGCSAQENSGPRTGTQSRGSGGTGQ